MGVASVGPSDEGLCMSMGWVLCWVARHGARSGADCDAIEKAAQCGAEVMASTVVVLKRKPGVVESAGSHSM